MKYVIATVVAVFALSGCQDTVSTQSNLKAATGSAAQYSIVTDWRRIAADSDVATDIWVRTIKIDGACFVQSSSQRDWSYTLTATGSSC